MVLTPRRISLTIFFSMAIPDTNKYSLNLVYKDTKFRLSHMGGDAGALGAAMLIRNQVIGL